MTPVSSASLRWGLSAALVATASWGQGEEGLAYADHLFAGQHDYDAITEYLRFTYAAPESQGLPYAWYRIGLALERAGDGEAAERYLSRARERAQGPLATQVRLALADSYVRTGFLPAAQRLYDELLEGGVWPERAADLRMRKAVLALRQMQVGEAIAEADKARSPGGAGTEPRIGRFVEELRKGGRLPYRSPRLAGWMSWVLPGSGQVYAGQTGRGLRAFLLNGLLAYAAYSSLADGLYVETAVFYVIVWRRYHVGNAMVAEQAARDFNTAAWDRYTDTVTRLYTSP